jgi:hypothetical protein
MTHITLDADVPYAPNQLAGFNPYHHTYGAVPPNDPLGWVGVENNPELQFIPVGMPITVVGNDPGRLPGTWTGVVTLGNEHWIGFTPDTTEYLGDGSAAWDDYVAWGDCHVTTYRYDELFIDWRTRVIYVPKTYLTLVSGTLYELDTDALRLTLKGIEDDSDGMAFPDTHRRNAPLTVAGVTLAQTIEIINGYSIMFEDGLYSVRLAGSNNNLFDISAGILVQNTVQVIPTNTGGLVVAGNTTPESLWARQVEAGFTAEELMRLMAAALAGKISGAATTEVSIRDVTDTKDRIVATVDADGNRSVVVLDPT